MLLDHGANAQHELEMGIIRGDGKRLRLEAIVLAEAALEVFELRQDEKIVTLPVQQDGVNLGVSLRAPPVREGPCR